MANRDQGKVHFMDLMDQNGRMQLFVKGDNIGQEAPRFADCFLSVSRVPDHFEVVLGRKVRLYALQHDRMIIHQK